MSHGITLASMHRATHDDRRLAVTDGVSLRALVWPSGNLEPWLLVHGLASNCRTWERVAARLNEHGHPVAAVDLRGNGRSDKPNNGYDFATMAADLAAALDSLDWPTALVAGQSMGGNLVVDFAARHPNRVGGVAGVDGGSIELSHRWANWDDCAKALRPPALAGSRCETVERMLRAGHPGWDDWGIEVTLDNMELLDDGTIRPWLTLERHMLVLRALWEHRPSEVLPALEAPTLLVFAGSGATPPTDWDLAKRAEAARIAELAPHVEMRWFEPADHDIHVQLPDELADLLHETLGKR